VTGIPPRGDRRVGRKVSAEMSGPDSGALSQSVMEYLVISKLPNLDDGSVH